MPGALSYYINASGESRSIADIEEVRRRYRELEFQRKMQDRTNMYNMIGKLISIAGSVGEEFQNKEALLNYAKKKGINTTSGKFYNILFDPKFEKLGREMSADDVRSLMFFDEYSANRGTLFDFLNTDIAGTSQYKNWRQNRNTDWGVF